MNCKKCGEPLNGLHILDGCTKRTSEDTIERATKVMHAEVCCPCDPQGCHWTHTREAQYAYALADAGLLARPLPTREQLADTIWDALEDGGWVSTSGHYPYEIVDAVLALLKGQDA